MNERSRLSRQGFWILLIGATLLEVGLDVIALRGSNRSDAASAQVVRSYQLIDEINQILFEISVPDAKPIDPVTRFAHLRALAEERPSLQARLERLDPLDATDGARQRALLWELSRTERAELRERLARDHAESQRRRRELLFASAFDLLLLTLLAWIWIQRHRETRRKEQRLAGTIRALGHANRQLAAANASNAQALKTTAHDLINPLGSIRGFADLIREEMSGNPSVTAMCDVIQRISNQTLSLVTNLVATRPSDARTSARPPSADGRVNVTDCLRHACASLQPQAQAKGQRIALELHEAAALTYGDAHRLTDAFVNLIGNAIKFSPRNAATIVRLALHDTRLRIEVEDEGPGIPPSERHRAFLRYQRLGPLPTGGEPSNGLGLAIVKETVERHHGRVWLEDTATGRGIRFVVELPLRAHRTDSQETEICL